MRNSGSCSENVLQQYVTNRNSSGISKNKQVIIDFSFSAWQLKFYSFIQW